MVLTRCDGFTCIAGTALARLPAMSGALQAASPQQLSAERAVRGEDHFGPPQ